MEEMGNPWELEHEEREPELEFVPKAHLVLEGSDKHEWGLVKDCHGCVNFIPENAEVVGTWNKYGEGTFWVDLTTPLEALRDRAIQLYKELAEARVKTMAEMSLPPKTTVRRPRVTKEQPVQSGIDKLLSRFTVPGH